MIPFKTNPNLPPNTVAMVNVKTKPIVLAPGQSINSLSLAELLDRGIDWEATAKASLWVKDVGENNDEDRCD